MKTKAELKKAVSEHWMPGKLLDTFNAIIDRLPDDAPPSPEPARTKTEAGTQSAEEKARAFAEKHVKYTQSDMLMLFGWACAIRYPDAKDKVEGIRNNLVRELTPLFAASEKAIEMQARCFDCNRNYGEEFGFPDLVLPDDAWRSISPDRKGSGLLCPSCICQRLYAANIKTRGKWTSGPLCGDLAASEKAIDAGGDSRWAEEFVKGSVIPTYNGFDLVVSGKGARLMFNKPNCAKNKEAWDQNVSDYLTAFVTSYANARVKAGREKAEREGIEKAAKWLERYAHHGIAAAMRRDLAPKA